MLRACIKKNQLLRVNGVEVSTDIFVLDERKITYTKFQSGTNILSDLIPVGPEPSYYDTSSACK